MGGRINYLERRPALRLYEKIMFYKIRKIISIVLLVFAIFLIISLMPEIRNAIRQAKYYMQNLITEIKYILN